MCEVSFMRDGKEVKKLLSVEDIISCTIDARMIRNII
jgi:hypothetical protein